ncbi:hypothetical protein Mal64_03710 [Pseudobythopirellula maris]|uniref:PEP-CTERM protein-sorting domain-containing protein n=2 Tax=Pseudobythopirellula maris TaxID=2527991 RepID=A0A5C5ZR71_9BACT|nr:hypothetical protein Mal64_03710 [Pseudobythopirellula maris]
MVTLGDLPGGKNSSIAYDVSADGTVVVGESTTDFGREAFIWTAESGMQPLGIPIVDSYFSIKISGDGSRIVVWSAVDSLGYWEEGLGAVDLIDHLTNTYGLDFSGWDSLRVHDISDDGNTILGSGRFEEGGNQAWIAHIAPETAPGDFDGDGQVSLADYDKWVADFGQPSLPSYGADGSGDGVVDAADFTVWRDHYEPPGAPPVPEPTTIALLLFSVCSIRRRRGVRFAMRSVCTQA